MTHEIHFNKAEVFIAGAPTMFGHWGPRELAHDELSTVSGAGNIPGAIMGGLQGAVVGGVTSAAGAMAIGGHWPSAGIAGMVSGGLGGAFAGFTGGPR